MVETEQKQIRVFSWTGGLGSRPRRCGQERRCGLSGLGTKRCFLTVAHTSVLRKKRKKHARHHHQNDEGNSSLDFMSLPPRKRPRAKGDGGREAKYMEESRLKSGKVWEYVPQQPPYVMGASRERVSFKEREYQFGVCSLRPGCHDSSGARMTFRKKRRSARKLRWGQRQTTCSKLMSKCH